MLRTTSHHVQAKVHQVRRQREGRSLRPTERALLELQRAAGNRAVAAHIGAPPLALQRYTVEQNYNFGGAHGQTMLRSQGLRFASGKQVRTTKRLFNGALMNTTEAFNPAADDGRGAWEQEGRPTLAPVNPPMKVSNNAQLALEAGGQAKVFFIDPALVAASNAALTTANAPVLIATTNATITLPAVGARPARILRQATVTEKTNPVAVAELEDTLNETLQMETECHNIANQLIKRDPTTARARRGPHGKPRVGEAYHFKSRSASYVAPVGGDPEQQMRPFRRPGPGEVSFKQIITSLTAFDQQLEQLSEKYSMYQAMGAARRKSTAVKAFLPGWGGHSEAVVALDKPDRLTLANYNRATEADWVTAHAFREAYRNNQAFRRWFRPWYTQKLQKEFNLAAGGSISAEMLALVYQRFAKELLEEMASHVPQEVAAARRAAEFATRIGRTLWYFDMYGRSGQSFQKRYRVLGARRMDGSATTAV